VTDDTPTDGFAAALARAAGAVARMAVGEQKTNAMRDENTLLHGETLLIVSTGNAKDVAFPFVTEGVTGDFLRDFLVIEDTAVTKYGYKM
jgi:hypothetical protein